MCKSVKKYVWQFFSNKFSKVSYFFTLYTERTILLKYLKL